MTENDRMRRTADEIRGEARNPGNHWLPEFASGMEWAAAILDTRSTEVDEFWQLAALTEPDRLVEGKHACPVEGCGLSAEEHHALTSGTFALMVEVRTLRQQLESARRDASQQTTYISGVVPTDALPM